MLNKVLIMGRLTRDPELKQTNSGVSVVSFSLAVERDFKDKQSGEKTTDFIDCVAWRGTADFVAKYFTKGRMAVVEGKIQVRDWMDKEGNKRKAVEVVADNVYFADSKKDGGSSAPVSDFTAPPVGEFVDITAELASGEDELPF
jgi:single-strand DNA-binding protein